MLEVTKLSLLQILFFNGKIEILNLGFKSLFYKGCAL